MGKPPWNIFLERLFMQSFLGQMRGWLRKKSEEWVEKKFGDAAYRSILGVKWKIPLFTDIPRQHRQSTVGTKSALCASIGFPKSFWVDCTLPFFLDGNFAEILRQRNPLRGMKETLYEGDRNWSAIFCPFSKTMKNATSCKLENKRLWLARKLVCANLTRTD